MCEKIISSGSARKIDPCLIEELEDIKKGFIRFNQKFRMIESCCGHGKYSKTLIVLNIFSHVYFEWFSGEIIGRAEVVNRTDTKLPVYKRDKEGYYFVPEVDEEK